MALINISDSIDITRNIQILWNIIKFGSLIIPLLVGLIFFIEHNRKKKAKIEYEEDMNEYNLEYEEYKMKLNDYKDSHNDVHEMVDDHFKSIINYFRTGEIK